MSTVLLVDDEPGVLFTLSEVLTDRGHRVLTAKSGAEALTKLDDAETVVTDLSMPGMDGIELLRTLNERGYRLPAIMITGNSDVHMAVEAMKSGASDFIEKPLGGADLLAGVARALEQSRDSSKLFAWREDAARHVAALTLRQRQIMELVLAGHPSKNIAADLGISQRTVENHRAAIMHKSGAASLPALARLALAADGAAGRPADEEPSRLD